MKVQKANRTKKITVGEVKRTKGRRMEKVSKVTQKTKAKRQRKGS